MAGRVALPIACLAAALLSGCIGGATEKSGSVGDKLEAKRVEVTVERIDRRTPTPRRDITGLSLPSRGYKLVGVLAYVCSGYGAAIGQQQFELESSAGPGRPKYTARNYRNGFETVRDECERGWMVWEIPADSSPTKVRFSFDETGNSRDQADNLEARFEWDVE